jgi:hypothetical protein
MLSRKMKEDDPFRVIRKELTVLSEPVRATSMFEIKNATAVSSYNFENSTTKYLRRITKASITV